MKYNLSEIMKKAWNMVRNNGMTISEALKLSWARAKRAVEGARKAAEIIGKKLAIKEWFYRKNSQNFFFRNGSASRFFDQSDIVKETEKAYNLALEVESHDGERVLFVKNVWVPKNCVETR